MSAVLDVLAMGRALVDLYPAQDGPLECVLAFEPSVGGSPANVAIAAARLGRRSGIVSRVGDDGLGRYVIRELTAAGVDVAQVRVVKGSRTPVAVCEISPPDAFPLTIYRPEPAVDLAIRVEELDATAVESARVLWVSLSGLSGEPSRTAHREAMAARAGAAHTVLDLDFRAAFWTSEAAAAAAVEEVFPYASVLVGNLDECRIAFGTTDPDGAAEAMLAAGARLAVVKLGGDGVLARTRNETIQLSPIPVTVANGLGSGDAFGAALCYGLLEGWRLPRVMSFANAAGALVASRRECSPAMPTVAEVEKLEVRAPSR